MSESVYSEYISKIFRMTESKGVIDGDRLELIRFLWKDFNPLNYLLEELASNKDFLRVIEDDESFSYIVKSFCNENSSNILYTEITGDATNLLPYSDLKAFLHFNSYFNKARNYYHRGSREVTMRIASDSNSRSYWKYESNSFLKTKEFNETPAFRIVRKMKFTERPVSHEYFLNDWAYLVNSVDQYSVAEWFESRPHVYPSIFAIWYVTEFFAKDKAIELGVHFLDETPFEWLAAID